VIDDSDTARLMHHYFWSVNVILADAQHSQSEQTREEKDFKEWDTQLDFKPIRCDDCREGEESVPIQWYYIRGYVQAVVIPHDSFGSLRVTRAWNDIRNTVYFLRPSESISN
jgi:hypothetical protein